MFFIYTLIGSLFLLLAIVTLYIETGTTDYQILLTVPISNTYQIWLWLGFFLVVVRLKVMVRVMVRLWDMVMVWL